MKIIPAVVFATVAALSQVALAADQAPAKPAAAPAEQQVMKALPADVVADMEKLVEAAVQQAAGPLQTTDAFQPYGALMLNDGKFQSVRWGKPNPPPADELFRQINLAIMAEAKKPEIKAAATVAPSMVPTTDGKQVTGIRVEVDHRKGEPRIVFIPFARENGKLILGTFLYLPGVNPLFERPAAAATPAAAKPAAKPAPAKSAAKPAPKPAPKPAAAKP